MIEDLMSLKKQIETMIETYKDLHPGENYKSDMSAALKQYISIYGKHPNDEYVVDDVGQVYNPTNIKGEECDKEEALKKIREGTYESTFRKKQRQETTKHSEGSPSLCVYGDS